MRCIYCNDESDLTVSDIIPAALTGAKLTRRFVCRKHNAFTNENYESIMIKNLAVFRNLIGLSERDGGPVRFRADLTIGEYTFPNQQIADRKSVLSMDGRILSTKTENGQRILLGDTNDLLKISGATSDSIKAVNSMTEVTINVRSDMRELFISNASLHTIAKIAYEWHCFYKNIDGFDLDLYGNIVSYITNPSSDMCPVEIITDTRAWSLMDHVSRTGTNLVFEYQGPNGDCYVVFGLWGVILYKIRICGLKKDPYANDNRIYEVTLFHTDGSKESVVIGTIIPIDYNALCPEKGLEIVSTMIKERLGKLGERDISLDYIRKNIKKMKPLIEKYKMGRCSFNELIDYDSKDSIIPIYILELLMTHCNEYSQTESFNENMVKILGAPDRYVISQKEREETLQRYIEMDKNNTFAKMLEDAIIVFEIITGTTNKPE